MTSFETKDIRKNNRRIRKCSCKHCDMKPENVRKRKNRFTSKKRRTSKSRRKSRRKSRSRRTSRSKKGRFGRKRRVRRTSSTTSRRKKREEQRPKVRTYKGGGTNFKCDLNINQASYQEFANILRDMTKDKYDETLISNYKEHFNIPLFKNSSSYPSSLYASALIEMHHTCKDSLNPKYLATYIYTLYQEPQKHGGIWFYSIKDNELLAFGLLSKYKLRKEDNEEVKNIVDSWKRPYLLKVLCSKIRGGGTCIIESMVEYAQKAGSNVLLVSHPVPEEETFYKNRGFVKDDIITDWFDFWIKHF